jgi:predicted DNA-binding transcriptional regulator YafY
MFTADEANALLMAGKVVEKFTDRSVNIQFDSALYKIKSVLPESGKELLSKLQPNIQVFFSASRENTQGFLSDIQMAIARQRTVTLDYYSQYRDEATKNRIVEPIGICFYSMHWHLIAYCRFRDGYRDFRIDRIRDLRINNEDFIPRKRLSLQEYFAGLMNETDLVQVTIRTEPATWTMLQNIRYYYGFVSEETVDGITEMDFMVSDLNYFGRWILTFADGMEVVRPESLKTYLRELLQKIIAKHGE